jgi:hypothetical protein
MFVPLCAPARHRGWPVTAFVTPNRPENAGALLTVLTLDASKVPNDMDRSIEDQGTSILFFCDIFFRF